MTLRTRQVSDLPSLPPPPPSFLTYSVENYHLQYFLDFLGIFKRIAAPFSRSSVVQYNTIQPLFTLGSVYSTSASGAEQTIETNIKFKCNINC